MSMHILGARSMSQPLCVAYFDLGYSKEQYTLQPTRYGGGAIVARHFKEDPEVDFHVFAPSEAFENVGPTERVDRCHALPEQICHMLQQGFPVSHIHGAPELFDRHGFDLILHGHTCFALNRGSYRGPMVHWSGFDGSAGNPGNTHILLYDTSFTPQFGERAKYVRIGKPVPAQCPTRVGGDYVVQVSRHDDHMNTIAVAKQCLQYGIKGVFAGPIHNGYPLMEYIDGKTTHYLGEITEEQKLDNYSRARLFTLLHAWPQMPFNQSVIEAQGQGCPIYVNRAGPFLTTYLKHGVNGFAEEREVFGGEREMTLQEAFERASEIDSRACWEAARGYDTSVMISSFKAAFIDIVAEWRAEHPSL